MITNQLDWPIDCHCMLPCTILSTGIVLFMLLACTYAQFDTEAHVVRSLIDRICKSSW